MIKNFWQSNNRVLLKTKVCSKSALCCIRQTSNGVKKIILIIIDGLGDKPIAELGNKTPLEAAYTPNLDYLAKNGICGLMEPCQFSWEKEPTSEGAHIGLFGYQGHFLGRGVYEVAGIGMAMQKGDVALRVNFATVDKNLKIVDRRAGRIEKTRSLVKALAKIEIEGIKFLLKKSYGHRAGLILRGKNLSDKISDGDSDQVELKPRKIVPLNNSKQARFTADILNKFLEKAYQILESHSLNKRRKNQGFLAANYLLVRGAGKYKKMPSFKKRYNLKAACIAGGALYKGIAKTLGMDLIKVKGATGLANTNLKGKFLAVKNALRRKYNFVFCHIKATDTYGHDGDFLGKKKFIETIDEDIKTLFGLKNILLIITADHSTPCQEKGHSADPVPILVWGAGKDEVAKFSERTCQKGKLGKFGALKLFSKILELSEG